MTPMPVRLLVACLVLLLTGCSSMKITDFEGQTPHFRLEEYFAGETRAWGIVRDRFGTLQRQFTVVMNGTWRGDVFMLSEEFRYSDGSTEQRIWEVRLDGADGYRASAPGVIGEAVGRAAGNALNWRYTLALPISGQIWHINFDDWMFLQPDGVLINQAEMRKFGFRLGEVVLFFRKDEQHQRTGAGVSPAAAAAASR